jgi:hypothetical protein
VDKSRGHGCSQNEKKSKKSRSPLSATKKCEEDRSDPNKVAQNRRKVAAQEVSTTVLLKNQKDEPNFLLLRCRKSATDFKNPSWDTVRLFE